MPTLDRATLIGCVQATLERNPDVDCAWEGGSAAFDALDAYSDVDVVAVAADAALTTVFMQIEAALQALTGVDLRYLARDLPPEVCQRIERLAFVRDLEDVGVQQAQAREWFGRIMAVLERDGPGAGMAA